MQFYCASFLSIGKFEGSTAGILAGTALVATMATLGIIRNNEKATLSKDRFFHIKVKIKQGNLQFTI